MDKDRKIKMLQSVYAAVLADNVLQLGSEGVLDRVTERKRGDQLATGAMKAAQFGIEKIEDVFKGLYEIFGCSPWEVERKEDGLTAETASCMLCFFAKRMGAKSPCRIHCLDPMEGMVNGLEPGAEFIVRETLWDGGKCRVDVKSR